MTFFHSFNCLLFLLWLQADRIHAALVTECMPVVQEPIANTGSTDNIVQYSCPTVYVFDGVTFSGGSSGLSAGNFTLLPGGPPATISHHTFSLGPSANSIAVDGTLTALSPQTATSAPAPGSTKSAEFPSTTVALSIYTVSGTTLTGNPTSLYSGSNTLTPGATPVTVSSHTLSIPISVTGGQSSIDGTPNTLPTRSPASSLTQSISLTSNRITSVYEIAGVTSTDTVPPADLSTQLVTSTWTSNTWLTTTVSGKETIVPVLVGCAHCGGTGRGVIVWNYPPFPDVTFQFPKLPNGDIVDPFHLPCIPIPLIKTCSSPPVDDPPVDGAAGGVDPDPTSSASSFAASSTSSRQICSFLCSACANNDPPSSYPTPSKLRKRNPPHLGKSLSTYSKHVARFKKRVLPVPDDKPWDGDVATFLYAQIEIAEDSGNEVALRSRGIEGISSALAIELRAVSLNMVIQGMYGCTAVFVISDRLVWGSHFWEDEAFKASDAVFKASVLDLLGPGDGTPQMPGLTQFTGGGGRLALATRPKIFIVTPGFVSGSGAMFYPNKIIELEDTLTGILGQDVPVKLILYDPVDPPAESDSDGDSDEDVEWTPEGRLLFQYDPVQERCNGVQTAMWRLWIQDELREEDSWPATTDQLVAQRKREDIDTAAAVCSASSTTSSSGKTPTGKAPDDPISPCRGLNYSKLQLYG